MLQDRVMVRFGGTQEQQACDRERQARPELKRWLLEGAKTADRIAAPRIQRGVFGRTIADVDAAVDVLCQDALRSPERAGRVSAR